MLYWINKKIEKDNVVILSKTAILLGSCNKQLFDKVEICFENNENPVAVLGKENISLLPFKIIQKTISSVTVPDIEISVKTPNGLRKKTLSLSDFGVRDKCFLYLKKLTVNTTKLKKPEQPKPEQLKQQPNIASIKSQAVKPDAKSLNKKSLDKNSQDKRITENEVSSEQNFQYELVEKREWLNKKTAFIAMGLVSLVLGSFLVILMMSGSASLYDAIQTQTKGLSSAEVESYLNDGADINYQGEDGVTPLLSAINHGKEELVVTLVNKGADLDNNYSGETVLDIAIASGLTSAVTSMLNKQAPSSRGEDLLTRAIQNKLGLDIVGKIISQGSNVNYINENGSSVLAIALLFSADDNVVKLLLVNGASTSIMINGIPPVEFARSRGKMPLASMLARY